MIERLLWLALTGGIQRAVKEPRFLRRHLEASYSAMGLKSAEIDKMIQAFTEIFGKHPKPVIHQYARRTGRFPIYAIVLGDEHETQALLGNFMGEIPQNPLVDSTGADPTLSGAAQPKHDADAGVPIYGAFEGHTFHVLCYSDHPDITLLMYYAAKVFVRRALSMFKAAQLSALQLSGGDVEPDLQYFPETIFVRRLTFTCQSQEAAIADLSDREMVTFNVDVQAEPDGLTMLDGTPAGVWAILDPADGSGGTTGG